MAMGHLGSPRIRFYDEQDGNYLFQSNMESMWGRSSAEYCKKLITLKSFRQQRYEASEYDYREAKIRIENWHPIHQDPSPNSINTICILGPSRSGKSTLEKPHANA